MNISDLTTGKGIVRTSMAFNQDFMDDNPNTVLGLVAAVYKSRHDMFEHPDQDAEYYAKAADLPLDEARDAVDLELSTEWLPADGRCSEDTADFMKEVLLSIQPNLESVDPMDACDNGVIDKLHEMGFDQYDLETS